MRRTILTRPQTQRTAAKSTQVAVKNIESVEEPFARLLVKLYKGLTFDAALVILSSPIAQDVATVTLKNVLVQDICKGYVGIGCNETLIADISLVISNGNLADKLTVRDVDQQLLEGKMTSGALSKLVAEASVLGTEGGDSLAKYLQAAVKRLSDQETLLETIAIAKTFASFKLMLKQYIDAEAMHRFEIASGLQMAEPVDADTPCRVCGCKKVYRNYIQTRSADEPTTIIEFCAKCPRS